MMKLKYTDGIKLYNAKEQFCHPSNREEYTTDDGTRVAIMTDTYNLYRFEFRSNVIHAWQNGESWFLASAD